MSGPKTNERPGTRAQARHVRGSASKARRVLNLIRNESIGDARTILQFSETGVSETISKVLESAIANAGHNDGINEEDLYVAACYADEGVTLKRFRPRARGRASRINKRTAHITVIVARYEADELESRRERQTQRGGTSAAQAEARRRRVQSSQSATDDSTTDDSGESESASTAPAAAASASTDLTDITGIGPKFAEELTAAGIADIKALAAISDDQREELRDSIQGDDIDGWVEQAQALVDGDAQEEE